MISSDSAILLGRTCGVRVLGLAMLMMCSSLTAVVMAQEVNLVLETPTTVIAPGATFEVTVVLENPGELSIQGIQHVVSWDSSYLQLLSVTLPGELAGSPTPYVLAWNAPAPAGPGGTTGCSQWWDGNGTEAFSFGLVILGDWTESLTPLASMEMRVLSSAPNDATLLSSPPPDFTCGWLGSIVTDAQGDIIATTAEVQTIQVSDLPNPTPFECAEAAGIVYLDWLEPIAYDFVRIERDGVAIAEIAAGVGQYQDPGAQFGSTSVYQISGFSASVPSPPSSCSVTVDGIIDAPDALTCLDSGTGVLLSWQNHLPYSSLTVNRQGSLYQTLPADTSTFVDSSPIEGILVIYHVMGTIDGELGEASECMIEIPGSAVYFIRGDVTTDGQLDLSDPVTTLHYLFLGGDMPCASAADHDDSGSLDLADAVSLLSYLFIGGTPPAPPHPLPGTDPTPDNLGCLEPCPETDCSGGMEGDECLGAISIGLGSSDFDTTNMTSSIDAYDDLLCSGSFLGAMFQDIWFEFTAPDSGSATFSLCSKEVLFDTDLVVYQGDCASLLQIGCSGDAVGCPPLTSEVQNIPVTSGTSYLVRVGGWNQDASGAGVLSITID
ncbi:MAG: hypothetical protein AAEJ65_10465 [Planctomycetota bacterium]